jgi:TRAP-type uncharacterized transport system fused permease subunit
MDIMWASRHCAFDGRDRRVSNPVLPVFAIFFISIATTVDTSRSSSRIEGYYTMRIINNLYLGRRRFGTPLMCRPTFVFMFILLVLSWTNGHGTLHIDS